MTYNLAVELNRLQAETKNWRDRNFPNQSSGDQLLGVIEEVGELSHSYLKGKQSIRGTHEEHYANAKDAVGDIMIYLMGYATKIDVYMSSAIARTKPIPEPDFHEHGIFYLSNRVGRLAHWECLGGNGKLDAIKRRVIGEIVHALNAFCLSYSIDILEVTYEAWEQVQKRDWIANPVDGTT